MRARRLSVPWALLYAPLPFFPAEPFTRPSRSGGAGSSLCLPPPVPPRVAIVLILRGFRGAGIHSPGAGPPRRYLSPRCGGAGVPHGCRRSPPDFPSASALCQTLRVCSWCVFPPGHPRKVLVYLPPVLPRPRCSFPAAGSQSGPAEPSLQDHHCLFGSGILPWSPVPFPLACPSATPGPRHHGL